MIRLLCPALLIAALLAPNSAWSASEDECAGWLCIFVGFALPECEDPRNAMLQRILEFKSPLPSFGSCSADGNADGYDVHMTLAARIGNEEPPRFDTTSTCRYDDDNQSDGDRIPAGCTGTYRLINVTQHGVQVGDIFYMRARKPSSDGTSNFDDKN